MNTLRHLARRLGGEVAGKDSINCPGPAHSATDRSLSVRFDASATDGFEVYSFAGDDWRICREHVRSLLGIVHSQAVAMAPRAPRRIDQVADARALTIWGETVELPGSLAARYLRGRGIAEFGWASDLRFHPSCPFGGERLPCMVALYRDITTNEPRAIHRTALSRDGHKIDRKALGRKRMAAIKLSEDAEVSVCLSIAEGLETALAAAAEYYRPIWALGDANAIGSFPVLSGIESVTIIVDNDVNGVGQRAARDCSERWTAAGREVFRILPTDPGADMADIVARRAA